MRLSLDPARPDLPTGQDGAPVGDPGDQPTGAPGTTAPGHVTAVVVSSDPRRARAVLDALDAQTRPADATTAVAPAATGPDRNDLGSRVGHVVPGAASPGTGAALAAALSVRPPADPPVAPGDDTVTDASGRQWLWLLHDGAVPAPDALQHLLSAVELGPSIAVAGCKQRDLETGTRLVSAGLTTTRHGRPVTGADDDHLDQGQLDHRDDVLAVSTSGMLVRRDVLERLGGPPAPLAGTAAAIDLCRRVRRAGYRVVVVPGAVVRSTDRTTVSRADAARLRLLDAPARTLPLVVLQILLGVLLRLPARIGAKRSGGLADVAATLGVLARPDRIWRARRAAARTRARPRPDLTPLLASRTEVARWHRDRWLGRRTARPGPAPHRHPAHRWVRWAGPLTTVLVLTAAAVTGLHRLLGPGTLTGGALAALPPATGHLAGSVLSPWRPAGPGAPGAADPLDTVLLTLSVLLGGALDHLPAVLLVAAVPAAGLGAWWAAGRATTSWPVRGWAALTWASAPALLGATTTGRIGAVLVHVALPLVVLAVTAVLQAPTRRHAWPAAAGGSLALAVVLAGAPVLLLPAVVLLVALVVTRRHRAGPLLWVLVPPLALLGPWLLDAVSTPRALVADPGAVWASDAAPAWLLLLGHPTPVVVGPLGGLTAVVAPVLTGTTVLVALLALLRPDGSRAVVRAGWWCAAAGLLTAGVSARVDVAAGAGATVRGWTGTGLSLALVGFLVAAVAGSRGLDRRLAVARRPVRAAAATGLTLALLAPAAGLGLWAWWTATDPAAVTVQRGDGPRLPGVALDIALSGDQVRTLVLRQHDDAVAGALVRGAGAGTVDSATLVRAAGLRPVAPWRPGVPAEPDTARAAVDDAVAALAHGGTDPRPALADLGVGYVLLVPDPARPTGTLEDVLDATVGLARSGGSGDTLAWRVHPTSDRPRDGVDRPAATRVLDADGTPLAVVPASATGVDTVLGPGPAGLRRTLVLAERADPAWRATLDGRALVATTHADWAQAFELPSDGGHLVVGAHDPWAPAWRTLQVAVLVLTLLLAVPVGRRDRDAA